MIIIAVFMEISNFGGIPLENFKTILLTLDNPKSIIRKCGKTSNNLEWLKSLEY